MIMQNKLATHKTPTEKRAAFDQARQNGEYAVRSDLTKVPLKQLSMSQVEFIGGRWRVQNDFPYEIQMIRDREMVLLKKLPHQERMPFEYYHASVVSWNCYGPHIFPTPDYIVAKYTTDNGVYWGYGATIEKARAFLGIKLYDEHMDLIHNHACKNQLSRQKK